jgi:hypothetical protein
MSEHCFELAAAVVAAAISASVGAVDVESVTATGAGSADDVVGTTVAAVFTVVVADVELTTVVASGDAVSARWVMKYHPPVASAMIAMINRSISVLFELFTGGGTAAATGMMTGAAGIALPTAGGVHALPH